jgi:uroporphyrin-III C-methyltransferase
MATIYLVGAGPGDPELMTRKAWRLLGDAQVVLHDALMDVSGMREAAPDACWVNVGKRCDGTSVDQAFICRSLVGYAKRGLNVVRLKGGDPSLFGRMAEELAACREAGLVVEIVPGVTSACAAAADLQTSLTLRGVSRSVAFVTPRIGRKERVVDTEWLQVSLVAQTVVLYMAGKQSRSIAQALIAGGKCANTPVCVVENASAAGARFRLSLSDLARDGLPEFVGPVSLLMGEALRMAQVSDVDAVDVSKGLSEERAVG